MFVFREGSINEYSCGRLLASTDMLGDEEFNELSLVYHIVSYFPSLPRSGTSPVEINRYPGNVDCYDVQGTSVTHLSHLFMIAVQKIREPSNWEW